MPITLVLWVLVLQKLKREMEALQSSSRGLLQSYREEHWDCLSEIVRAVQTAQLHHEALLGKTDPNRRCAGPCGGGDPARQRAAHLGPGRPAPSVLGAWRLWAGLSPCSLGDRLTLTSG